MSETGDSHGIIALRPMRIDDVRSLVEWDDDPDVAAALGGRAADWYDWPTELGRHLPWREFLVIDEDERAVGFVQLVDASREETHYWGVVAPGTWALDVWIGAPEDRGRGIGRAAVTAAVRRVFDDHGAEALVIDPQIENRSAIGFYDRLGFEAVGERDFDDDRCLVMRMERPLAD